MGLKETNAMNFQHEILEIDEHFRNIGINDRFNNGKKM